MAVWLGRLEPDLVVGIVGQTGPDLGFEKKKNAVLSRLGPAIAVGGDRRYLTPAERRRRAGGLWSGLRGRWAGAAGTRAVIDGDERTPLSVPRRAYGSSEPSFDTMVVAMMVSTPALKAAAVCPFTISFGITTPERTPLIFRPTPVRANT